MLVTLARGKNGAGLRAKPYIKWDKDRGKEPQRSGEDFPWFWGWDPDNSDLAVDFPGRRTFDGNRWNDLHYRVAFKRAARQKRKRS